MTLACCCLCGQLVQNGTYSPDPLWMTQVRAVYALDMEAAHCRLSGLGQRSDAHDVVRAGGDDGGIGTELINLALNQHKSTARRIQPSRSDPTGSVVTGGYAFHAACWALLTAYGALAPPALRLLFNLCRSMPVKASIMNWGHDYGGREEGVPLPPAPGQEARMMPFPRMLRFGPDPLDIPELVRIFSSPDVLPSSTVTASTLEAAIVQPTGMEPETRSMSVFDRVPTEILIMMLVHLPSRDVAQLRLASRTFANLSLSDAFWRSRFLPGYEFQHIIEAHRPPSTCAGRWQEIYASIKALERTDSGTAQSLTERRRICQLGLSLQGLLETLRDVQCEGNRVRTDFEPLAGVESCQGAWVTASRALRMPTNAFSDGSRYLFERELRLLPVPIQHLTAIYASTIDLFGRRYVSGLRVLSADGKSVSLGYRLPRSEALVSHMDTPQNPRVGFCLAQDQSGVRGLAVVTRDDRMSAWVGDYRDIPQRRLVTQSMGVNPMEALKGGFDAARLVLLGVATSFPAPQPQQAPGLPPLPNLRNTALWYPCIPPPSLYFPGAAECSIEIHRDQELPLSYVLFGGLHGEHLGSISGLTGRSPTSDCGFLSLRVDSKHLQGVARIGSEDVRSLSEVSFAMDGERGERIVGVDTYIIGCAIHTSFGRAVHFPAELAESKAGLNVISSVRAQRDDLVVGFWSKSSVPQGIYALGLVCIKPGPPGVSGFIA